MWRVRQVVLQQEFIMATVRLRSCREMTGYPACNLLELFVGGAVLGQKDVVLLHEDMRRRRMRVEGRDFRL